MSTRPSQRTAYELRRSGLLVRRQEMKKFSDRPSAGQTKNPSGFFARVSEGSLVLTRLQPHRDRVQTGACDAEKAVQPEGIEVAGALIVSQRVPF